MHLLTTVSLLLSTATTFTFANPMPLALSDILSGLHMNAKRTETPCDCPAIGGDCRIWGYWDGTPNGVPVCTSHKDHSNAYICAGTYEHPDCSACAQSQEYLPIGPSTLTEQCMGTPVCYHSRSGQDIPNYRLCTDCKTVGGDSYLANYNYQNPPSQPISGTSVSKCDK